MTLATTNPLLAGDRPMAGTVLGHGSGKFPVGRLLGSSDGRNWSGLSAERRFHPAGDLPTFVPVYTEVALLVRGRSTVTRRAQPEYANARARRAARSGLCPAGLREDFIAVSRDITEVLHVYLPSQPFVALANDHSSQNFSRISLCYAAWLSRSCSGRNRCSDLVRNAGGDLGWKNSYRISGEQPRRQAVAKPLGHLAQAAASRRRREGPRSSPVATSPGVRRGAY